MSIMQINVKMPTFVNNIFVIFQRGGCHSDTQTLLATHSSSRSIHGYNNNNNNNNNKSAAGMQHTQPRDIFNAKKVILKLDLFMQSLKKIGKEMPKSEKPIYNVNQGP